MMLFLCVFIICCISLWLALTVSFCRAKKTKLLLCVILGFLYLVIVYWITLGSRTIITNTSENYIFIPFKVYWNILTDDWVSGGKYIMYAIVGNVLLFIPIGMLVTQMSKLKHKYLSAGIVGFIFSLAIEITQYFTMLGTFEVDDLIHNTWGAVIGYAIAMALIKKEKNIRTNLKTLMPLVAFIALIGTASIISIVRDIC